MKKSLVLVMIVLSFLSCKKKKIATQNELDEKIITNYISDNNLNATATGSGLYYVMTTTGTGIQPNANSNVTVNYKGSLKDGKVFDQSASTGATFNLGSVIKGWKEGIPLFKKGGKGILLIPSALGYGNQATGSIPANSVLIFDIDLINVQ
ncbi:MAG: FKBP-type peptidyl-prolyl cis-trans isomerase [Bacteroidota bacterium]|nr:FKBP-type peptidyl-prolyl cis-trans isomerase [Bacteroidota bacterium]MDP3146108.1 FKBP-type peptidyl-prolyl cis-trans isomerase [Bacteroidota bacterium]MDP3556734.1 FKBP-type peptidyl-prolyl cis-trans isomerase [Bacteroidota bacterium]